MTNRLSRRGLLGTVATLPLAGLAGCTDRSDDQSANSSEESGTDGSSGDEPTGDGRTDTDESTGTDDVGESSDDAEQTARDDSMTQEESTGGADGSEGTADGDGETADGGEASNTLDLREANVVGVSVEEQDGVYEFAVSLHHDDDGEEGYANWWQVEQLDGTRLGRRELTHPHSRQPFTRSERIDIPDSVTCVVVRGRDQTHGYGGQAILVDVETGATQSVDQGGEARSFSASDCP